MEKESVSRVSTSSDDEDGVLLCRRKSKRNELQTNNEEEVNERKPRQVGEKAEVSKSDNDDDGDEPIIHRMRRKGVELQSNDDEEEKEVEDAEEAKPVGEMIRFYGEESNLRSHYQAFEFAGRRYDLDDPVLIVPPPPAQQKEKPYVVIIKEITQTQDGSMELTGQRFYRPEDVVRRGCGGSWQNPDHRQLFYSFNYEKHPVEAVIHKCVVHFVPPHKQIPDRKQHPGFFVQEVYDTKEQKLLKFTDKSFNGDMQREIDLLVQKTLAHLGGLPDIETVGPVADKEDQSKGIRAPSILKREGTKHVTLKTRNPQGRTSNTSEYYDVLVKFKALTGNPYRDKWLERFLQSVRYMCNVTNNTQEHNEDKVKKGYDGLDNVQDQDKSRTNGSQDRPKDVESFCWPDDVIHVVRALEQVAHDTLSSDFQKYSQKLRQLTFNLKKSSSLACQLLNGELKPSTILNMNPNELNEGKLEEEMTKETDEAEHVQMTDARCARCCEFKVGIRDIIQTGYRSRYQLECIACGYSWFASRDHVSMVTTDAPGSTKDAGTVPSATAKLE